MNSLMFYLQLWDLSSRTLLTTFQFPEPISSLAWDVTERLFFAASADGSIHQMNLFRQRSDKAGRQIIEAVGGAGVTDIIRTEDDREAQKKRLISVGFVRWLPETLLSTNRLIGNQYRPWQSP